MCLHRNCTVNSGKYYEVSPVTEWYTFTTKHIHQEKRNWGKSDWHAVPIADDLVGGLEHVLFFHILGRIIPIDKLIFFTGVETTNQKVRCCWVTIACTGPAMPGAGFLRGRNFFFLPSMMVLVDHTRRCPPVVTWFITWLINHSNYRYIYSYRLVP